MSERTFVLFFLFRNLVVVFLENVTLVFFLFFDAAGDRATLIMVHNAGHGLVPRGRGPVSPPVVAVAASVVTFLTRVIPPTG